jgi:hypothetical protein
MYDSHNNQGLISISLTEQNNELLTIFINKYQRFTKRFLQWKHNWMLPETGAGNSTIFHTTNLSSGLQCQDKYKTYRYILYFNNIFIS